MTDETAERLEMDGLVLRELVPRPFHELPTNSTFCMSPKGTTGAFYGDGSRTVKIMDLTERNISVKTIRMSRRASKVNNKNDVDVNAADVVDCTAAASDTEVSSYSNVFMQYFDEDTLGILTDDNLLYVYQIESDILEEWEVPGVLVGDFYEKLFCLPDKKRVIISSLGYRKDCFNIRGNVYKLFSMVDPDSIGKKRLTELQTYTSFCDNMDRSISFIYLRDTVVINQGHDPLIFWDTKTGQIREGQDLIVDKAQWDGYVDENNHLIMFTGSHLIGFLGWIQVNDGQNSSILKPDIRREPIADSFLNNRNPFLEPCRLVRKPDGQFWDRRPNELVATICVIEGLRAVTILQLVSSPNGILKVLPNQRYLFFESFMDNVYLGQSLVGPGRDGFGVKGYVMGSESGRCFMMDFVTKDRHKLLAYVRGIHHHRLIKHVPVEVWKRISQFLFLSPFFSA